MRRGERTEALKVPAEVGVRPCRASQDGQSVRDQQVVPQHGHGYLIIAGTSRNTSKILTMLAARARTSSREGCGTSAATVPRMTESRMTTLPAPPNAASRTVR